jgi:hypothetical protein
MFEKVGRNDPCPCGSKLKFKKCCMDAVRSEDVDPPKSFSAKDRNIFFIESVADLLGLRKPEDWKRIKRDLSDEQVRQVYALVDFLWPVSTDLAALLPKPDQRLRGLFVGTERPESILENIVRYSLYSDEILVVSPFMNPRCIAPKYNPISYPAKYKADLLKLIHMLFQLEPWIRSGIVSLIPDPGDFDYSLRKTTWELGRQRWSGKPIPRDDFPDFERYAKADFGRFMARTPEAYRRKIIQGASPELDESGIQKALDIIESAHKSDPLALEQPVDEGGEIQRHFTGANLEMGLYIAQMTGAYLFTNLKTRWEEILSVAKELPESGAVWSPLTYAFQQTNFRFLDLVPPRFAYEMRMEGRLEPLRGFLRKIWNQVGGSPDLSKANNLARDFGDELKDQVSRTEADWKKIDQSLLAWLSGTASGALLTLGGIATGKLSHAIPSLGFSVAAVGQLLAARMKRSRFRKSVPLSVFIDLKRR